jgi:hypothetical protein
VLPYRYAAHADHFTLETRGRFDSILRPSSIFQHLKSLPSDRYLLLLPIEDGFLRKVFILAWRVPQQLRQRLNVSVACGEAAFQIALKHHANIERQPTERELRQAAQRLASVPLRAPVDRSPRVLLFGGVNRIFVNGPVKDFFEERGILTKTTEMSEFMCGGARSRPNPDCYSARTCPLAM